MKYNQLKGFEKHLRGAFPEHIPSVYLLVVHDPNLRSYLERQLNELFKKFGIKSENIHHHSSLKEAQSKVQQGSLFPQKELLFLTQLEEWDKESLHRLSKKERRPQEFWVLSASRMNDATVIDAFEKSGVVVQIPELKPKDKEKLVLEWLEDRAEFDRKKLAPKNATLLIMRLGANVMNIDLEWEKLCLLTEGKSEITQEDILSLVPESPNETIWRLLDALLAHRSKEALQIGRTLLQSGMDIIPLLRALRSQIETLLGISSIHELGKMDQLSELAPMKGWMLDQALRQAKGLSQERLQQAVMQIDELEIWVKEKKVSQESALDTFILNFERL